MTIGMRHSHLSNGGYSIDQKLLGKEFTPMVERLKCGELTACGRRALTQSEVVATQDPPSACADCPLAAHYGGRGAMTVRLEHGGKVYGLLSASIPAHLTADAEPSIPAASFPELLSSFTTCWDTTRPTRDLGRQFVEFIAEPRLCERSGPELDGHQ